MSVKSMIYCTFCCPIADTNIEFIHGSIYEYFVSEYIFCTIKEKINEPEYGLEEALGYRLKENLLSVEMLEFLKYRIRNSELNGNFKEINQSFQLMLENGMTYYIKSSHKKNIKNVFEREKIVFVNMLEIIHLWEKDCMGLRLAKTNYLKSSYDVGLNLSAFDLKKEDLEKSDLSHANLKGADLRGARLRYAILNETDLRDSRLTDSDFQSAHLRKIKIFGAEISEEHVKILEDEMDLHGTKVYIAENGEVINYEKYCSNRDNERIKKKIRLKQAKIDFNAFMGENKDKKISILEEAGLDPEEFDVFLD